MESKLNELSKWYKHNSYQIYKTKFKKDGTIDGISFYIRKTLSKETLYFSLEINGKNGERVHLKKPINRLGINRAFKMVLDIYVKEKNITNEIEIKSLKNSFQVYLNIYLNKYMDKFL